MNWTYNPNKRSKSNHDFENNQSLLVTESPNQLMGITKTVKTLNSEYQTKSIEHIEEYRISLLKNNAMFLRKKVMPLSEQNSSLKQRLQAMIYYMEQSRLEFASLLKPLDQQGNSRGMDKQIGDIFTICQALKDDIQGDATIRELKQNEIDALKEQILKNSAFYQKSKILLIDEFQIKSNSHQEEFNLKIGEIKQLQVSMEGLKKNILELKYQTSQHEQLHANDLMIKQKEVQFQIDQAQDMRRKCAQDIQTLKESHLIASSKQNQVHQYNLVDLRNECEDQIIKNNTKGQKLIVEMKILRAEHLSSSTLLHQIQSQEGKLSHKLEASIKENKRIRQQQSIVKEQFDKATAQVQSLKDNTAKVDKEKQTLEIKLSQSITSTLQQEDKNRLIQSENVEMKNSLNDAQNKLDLQKDQYLKQIEQQAGVWRKKIYQQQIKFEKLLAIKAVSRGDEIQFKQSNKITVEPNHYNTQSNLTEEIEIYQQSERIVVDNYKAQIVVDNDKAQIVVDNDKVKIVSQFNSQAQSKYEKEIIISQQYQTVPIVIDYSQEVIEGSYETMDFACQQDDTSEKEMIKILENTNQNIKKELETRILNDSINQSKSIMEFQEKKKILLKETQDQLQSQADQFNKECNGKIVNVKSRYQLQYAIIQKQLIKAEEECNATEFMMNKKVTEFESDIQRYVQEAQIKNENYVGLQLQLCKIEESNQIEKQTNIENMNQLNLQANEKQETQRAQNEIMMNEMEQINLTKQSQIQQLSNELDDTTKKKFDLNNNLIFVTQQSMLKSKQAVEREKFIEQQNEKIKTLLNEVEYSKKANNMFNPIKQPLIKSSNYVKIQTSGREQDVSKKSERIQFGGRNNARGIESQPMINFSLDQGRLPQVRAGTTATTEEDRPMIIMNNPLQRRSRKFNQ